MIAPPTRPISVARRSRSRWRAEREIRVPMRTELLLFGLGRTAPPMLLRPLLLGTPPWVAGVAKVAAGVADDVAGLTRDSERRRVVDVDMVGTRLRVPWVWLRAGIGGGDGEEPRERVSMFLSARGTLAVVEVAADREPFLVGLSSSSGSR